MFYVVSKLVFFLLRPSNAVIIAMAAGLLLRRFGHRRLGGAAFAAGFALLVAASFTGLSSLLLEPLEIRFPRPDLGSLEPTGLIVLGGALDTVASGSWDNLELIDGAERYVAAAALARQFPQARVVVTGGHMGFLPDERSEAELAADLFAVMGLPRERLVLETQSRNTRENATLSLALAEPRAGERWILITSAAHMPRAMGVFRTAGWPGLVAYPVDYRSLPGVRVIGRQFASEGLFLTDLAVKEWLGLLAYRTAGYTDAVFPRP